MAPIALDPDFESLAETLTSLSIAYGDSDPLNVFIREAAQAASLEKEQTLAQRRRQSQSQSHSQHRSLQQVLTAAASQRNLPIITTSGPSDVASEASNSSSNLMDISPTSPMLLEQPQLSHSQAAQKRLQALKSQHEQLNKLPTCLRKRERELDYTSTDRFVKLWFRDGHWSDNLEPTFRKDAPKMPNIAKLIKSLRRRKSDATMVSTISSSRSSSTHSDGSGSDTEKESVGRGGRRDRGRRDRQRDWSENGGDQTPIYLTAQKGKQPKTYRSSSNLYELPAGVLPEKSPLVYTPSNLSSSRLRSLASDGEDTYEPLNRALGAEGKDEVDEETFLAPRLRKRPGTNKLGDRGGLLSGRTSPAPAGTEGNAQNGSGVGGGSLPFWVPMGHTNGPSS